MYKKQICIKSKFEKTILNTDITEHKKLTRGNLSITNQKRKHLKRDNSQKQNQKRIILECTNLKTKKQNNSE